MYWWNHSIYGLLEVDVTTARQLIEEHKAQTGEALSFTGYLAFCLAHAVDEDKSVQAYLKGRRHLVIFDDVDVFLPVERELGGTHAAIPYIIRPPRAVRGWPEGYPGIGEEVSGGAHRWGDRHCRTGGAGLRHGRRRTQRAAV
jgi:hypothetical protein